MKDMMFGGYIARNHVGNNLTDRELRVLKDGDIDAMVSTFVKMRQEEYILQLKCVLKSLKHYLGDEMTLEKITIKEEYEGDFIGSQMMDGDMDIFFGIIGSDEVLLKVASDFAMEDFQEFDMDAYDAVCELINCTNGAFATRLCDDDIDVVLYPPCLQGRGREDRCRTQGSWRRGRNQVISPLHTCKRTAHPCGPFLTI